MWTSKVLIFALIAYATSDSLLKVTVNPSFRRLGYLATGLSYGHIHGTFDFGKLIHAQRAVVHAIDERIKTSASREEKMFIEALRPQMDSAAKTLEDLHALFFGHTQRRHKRQLLAGIGMVLSFLSMGTTIYTVTEVTKLHHQIAHLRDDFGHVAHRLEDEAHVINKLESNLKTLKTTCQLILARISTEDSQISMLTNVLGLITMIGNLNAELSAWGRGLEALSNGKLHPSLINHRKLQEAVDRIEEQAKTSGRRFLHDDRNKVFKAPVSYLATEDFRIIFIVHLALVDQGPMELFEYISTPVEVRNFYLEITANKKVLATDHIGQTGVEMTQEELLRCQTEERHNGRLFTCTNANLIRKDIRKTCLGAIFFGHREEVEQVCEHTLVKGKRDEVQQIAANEIVVFSGENTTITERCKNGTSYQTVVQGLFRKKTKPGCEVATREFLFKAIEDIEVEDNFLTREVSTSKFSFLDKKSDEKLERAIGALNGLQVPEPVRTEDIEKWISNEDKEAVTDGVRLMSSGVAVIISIVAAAIVGALYCRYRCSQKANEK